ncbi:DUF2788 domain-containing protein [Glaciecola petra]|uniref:DUF2788 domain-containing protein n=1 Tax=Glaciecola petra TaxID=3075602 RepID=A0ABU2ZPV8_9ALTE|nr:DUF2788 domain-containing protein [Aestuariibacter sp. P117]MDT0594384.1 DUF2788 domain-containing protein [Aestuariibacter sp. P117]
MSSETFQQLESILLNITLVGLFLLIAYAVHDVMKKNNVPMMGRCVAYGVLGLGCVGFLAKGIIQLFFISSGV